jgi:hypothetical protein
VKALSEVSAVVSDEVKRFSVFDTLTDRHVAKVVRQADDRLHEVLVGNVGRWVPDEVDVDLQRCDGRGL